MEEMDLLLFDQKLVPSCRLAMRLDRVKTARREPLEIALDRGLEAVALGDLVILAKSVSTNVSAYAVKRVVSEKLRDCVVYVYDAAAVREWLNRVLRRIEERVEVLADSAPAHVVLTRELDEEEAWRLLIRAPKPVETTVLEWLGNGGILHRGR